MLDNVSFELLKLYAQKTMLSIRDISAIYNIDSRSLAEPIIYLTNMGYLKQCPGVLHTGLFDISYSITASGHIALETEQKRRQHFKHAEFRSWSALVISIFALIISLLSWLLQILK